MAAARPPLAGPAFDALKAEVMRAAVELSDDQLLDLADGLHGLLRLRRPGRPISDPDGFLDRDPPWSG
jgi:hypothetical protein